MNTTKAMVAGMNTKQAADDLTAMLDRKDWRTCSRPLMEGARDSLTRAAAEIDRLRIALAEIKERAEFYSQSRNDGTRYSTLAEMADAALRG